MGRAARGVKGMEVAPEGPVVGMEVLRPGHHPHRDGAGLRQAHRPDEISPSTTGAARGSRDSHITKRNGPIMAILQVNEDDEIMLVTDGGKILRMIAQGHLH